MVVSLPSRGLRKGLNHNYGRTRFVKYVCSSLPSAKSFFEEDELGDYKRHEKFMLGPGRLGAVKHPSRFPMKIHFVWGFCVGAQGA
jgi:hypothetical protein